MSNPLPFLTSSELKKLDIDKSKTGVVTNVTKASDSAGASVGSEETLRPVNTEDVTTVDYSDDERPQIGNKVALAEPEQAKVEVTEYGVTEDGLAIVDVSKYGGKLVRMANGQALWRGQPHNWKPGPGRPKQALRDVMTQTLAKALPKLAKILQEEDLKKLSHRDRMKILDFLAKYGLGPEKDTQEASGTITAKLLILPPYNFLKMNSS